MTELDLFFLLHGHWSVSRLLVCLPVVQIEIRQGKRKTKATCLHSKEPEPHKWKEIVLGLEQKAKAGNVLPESPEQLLGDVTWSYRGSHPWFSNQTGGDGSLRTLFQRTFLKLWNPKIAGSKLIVSRQNGGVGGKRSLSASHLNLCLFRSQKIQAFSGPYVQEVFLSLNVKCVDFYITGHL